MKRTSPLTPNLLRFRDARDENGAIDTVYVTRGRYDLAVISYDTTWNCYVVDKVERGTIWSADCMYALAGKLDELNEERSKWQELPPRKPRATSDS